MEAHHFVPNNNAKHLKQTKSKNIAVLVKGTSNMLFANIVEEVQKMLAATRYSAEISYIDEDKNEVEQALILCRERKPMGILFLGGNPSNFQETFGSIEVPGVLITNRGNNLGFANLSSVAVDDVAAAKKAVDYLFLMGHEKIGILGDVTAIGAIRALKDHGLEVPEDISVIGFDGIDLAEYYNPKLTTIKQPAKELAVRGVEILFHFIDFQTGNIHEIVEVELMAGESVKEIKRL